MDNQKELKQTEIEQASGGLGNTSQYTKKFIIEGSSQHEVFLKGYCPKCVNEKLQGTICKHCFIQWVVIRARS